MEIDFEDNQETASALEYVLRLGMQGNHLLFDNERIRLAFAREEKELALIGSRRGEEVREAIRNILALPEFESKKDYISSLPPEIQDVIIYLYFQMIEKSIHLHQRCYH